MDFGRARPREAMCRSGHRGGGCLTHRWQRFDHVDAGVENGRAPMAVSRVNIPTRRQDRHQMVQAVLLGGAMENGGSVRCWSVHIRNGTQQACCSVETAQGGGHVRELEGHVVRACLMMRSSMIRVSGSRWLCGGRRDPRPDRPTRYR